MKKIEVRKNKKKERASFREYLFPCVSSSQSPSHECLICEIFPCFQVEE